MAGVIKSKGNQIFTTGVRQVNTDTGSGLVGQAMQRASNRIADQMYRDAVIEQREFGQQAALTAPIRDEKTNKLQFVDITEDMSRVARNAARPILERDYARAFKVDVETALIKARSESKTSDEFISKSQTIISGMRDAVPDEFQFLTDRVIDDSSTIVQNQHYNAMLLAESREQERIRLENLQIQYADQVDTVRALVQDNKYGSANAMREAILADMRETGTEDGLTDQFIKSITDQVDQAYYGEIAYRETDRLLNLGDEEGVFALRRAFLTGDANDSIPTMGVASSELDDDGKLRINMTPKLIDQDQLDSIGSVASRRVIANQIGVLHGAWSAKLAERAEAAAVTNLMNEVGDGNSNVTGDKAASRLDAGFAAAGVRTDVTGWALDETVSKIMDNDQLLSVMVNGNILPKSFAATLDGVASGDIQVTEGGLKNLLTLYNLSTKGIGEAGPVHRPKGMTDETFMFFEAVHGYANTFGADRVADGVNFLNMGSGRLKELESKIQILFKQPNQSAESIISQFMIENQDDFDGTFFSQPLTPGSIQKLMPVAIRAFGSLPKDQAVKVVADAYQAIYGETNLIRSPDGFEYKRHEFAPETFYGSRGNTYNVFLNKANDILAANTGNVTDVIGETHFLWPSNQSTNRKIVWTVVDAEGNYVRRNGSSMPLTINTDQINKSSQMQSAFKTNLEAKIARARNVRSAVIEQAEESLTGTGTQAEDYLTRRGIVN